jgi:class 3 adenylate cyclase
MHMNMREAIIAALRRDPELLPQVAKKLAARIDEKDGPISTVVQSAGALEPIIRDAVRRRPSKLGAFGLRSAHMLALLASEDRRSNKKLQTIAEKGTVGIVFVDIANFTSYTARVGDEAAVRLLVGLKHRIERAIKPTRGECVKALGDGFLLAFPSASQAVRGSTAVRNAVRRAEDAGSSLEVQLRIAVHAGEPSIEGDDLLGHDVNLTARLLDHCDPDEIVVSEAAKELAQRRLKKISFRNKRTIKIRGLTTPVVVFSV